MLIDKSVLLGESPLILDVLDQISRVAPLNKPVLILGERGTGKELVAERLHYLSKRWDQSFVKVNCASMNDNLLESELFGHEAGAFTGASKRHLGRFERADGGSLFLDELATSSASVQEKLLRVVEYGEFERVGGHQTVQCDVRLIAATHADVKKMSDEGRFRADLLDRLAFDVIHLPPLRLRRDDILLLAEHFARRMCLDLGWDYFPGFSKRAINQMLDHEWPGNVRELKNVVERSVYRMDEPDELLGDMLIDPFLPPWQAISEQGSSEQETVRKSDQIGCNAPPGSLRKRTPMESTTPTNESRTLMRQLMSVQQGYRQTRPPLGRFYWLKLRYVDLRAVYSTGWHLRPPTSRQNRRSEKQLMASQIHLSFIMG
jgi:psp operon transcriptional activator